MAVDVKYYEEPDDLMPKLRHLIHIDAIITPFLKLMDKKWKKAINEVGRVKPANDYLDGFLNSSQGRVNLFYIGDLLHKLGLSVAYEIFKVESGYDLFDESIRHQIEEYSQFYFRPGYMEGDPQVIYKLNDFINEQKFRNQTGGSRAPKNVISDIWDDLNLWPAMEGHKKPTKRGRVEYEQFLLNMAAVQSTPRRRKQSRYERMRDYSMEMKEI